MNSIFYLWFVKSTISLAHLPSLLVYYPTISSLVAWFGCIERLKALRRLLLWQYRNQTFDSIQIKNYKSYPLYQFNEAILLLIICSLLYLLNFVFCCMMVGNIKLQQKYWYIILLMRGSANLNDLMMSLGGKTDAKLGLTTTVK